ncbi:hypothetical protein [Rossellomorea aquimaris]|uniref:hypothetical protein n=1 Tax=Rossellomorea aquimaris TaxID=189382 RepID=UPI001CFF3085|nr:hypothetical protein [Rossellomorea aquimaris]
MKKVNKTVVFSTFGIAIFIFLLIPYITNLLMFARPYQWLAPNGIAIENPWIGYIATYYGATIGGLISGLFTYLGVKKTLAAQRIKDDEDHKRNHRAILEVQEIYGAELFLSNIKQRKGRLIITPQYKNAIALDLSDAHFNYIQFRNSGPGKIFNCSIKVEIEYFPSGGNFTTQVKVPVIFEGENIYVPIDKIKGENNQILNGSQYFIKNIYSEYETYSKESIKIVREIKEEGNKRLGIDQYSIKYKKDGNYVHLYEIEGTENEWYFLDDID